jgi:hypothetical protein
MKGRRPIVAVGVAVVLATLGAFLLPAVASAHDVTHTLKYVSVTVSTIQFTKTSIGLQDNDVSKGKTIGFDDVNLTITGSKTATADVAVDIKGGLLYGTVTTTNGEKTFSGKVTGGAGKYAGATGTITAKAIDITKIAVTISYST